MVKTTKTYQSKKPTSRKIKEKIKEYTPKAKSALFAGLAFARAHIKTIPERKKRRKKITRVKNVKKCKCRKR